MKLRIMLVVIAALLVGTFSALANAGYPEKSVTVICPWTAGGGTDVLLRALSKEAEKYLGQPIHVVNLPGGASAVGHNAIRTARPDGYTVGMITFELNSLRSQGLVPFTWKDFDPLMQINSDPAALTVRKDAPFSNMKEFIAYAKKYPGQLTVGNSAPGSVWHVAAGLMAEKTGIKVKHVPFDGAQPTVMALVSGHIKAVAVSVSEVRSQVQAGNLKILGVMDARRDAAFPAVPTMQEQGVDVQFHTWRGLALPLGVPADIRAKIADAYRKAFDSKEFKEFAGRASLHLAYQDSAGFSRFLAQNAKDVEVVMKSLGLSKK